LHFFEPLILDKMLVIGTYMRIPVGCTEGGHM
jgi:hypothetical protein